jgi:hypothetical protein
MKIAKKYWENPDQILKKKNKYKIPDNWIVKKTAIDGKFQNSLLHNNY